MSKRTPCTHYASPGLASMTKLSTGFHLFPVSFTVQASCGWLLTLPSLTITIQTAEIQGSGDLEVHTKNTFIKNFMQTSKPVCVVRRVGKYLHSDPVFPSQKYWLVSQEAEGPHGLQAHWGSKTIWKDAKGLTYRQSLMAVSQEEFSACESLSPILDFLV